MIKFIRYKIVLLLFLSIVLFACQQEKSPYFSTILKSEKGHLRGAQIGDSYNNILRLENDSFLIDQMEDYLHYEYELDMGNSYTVTYDFSRTNELYEIETTAYFDLIQDANLLFNHFNNHFTKKYGNGKKEEDGYTVWKTVQKKTNTNIEIAMINESVSYGIITIKIRDLDY
ncbi:MAG: hypothetical protein J5I47_12965 [Vicingus serpentipes]|nr:hypothetical protein [Vicingus serpentipes]